MNNKERQIAITDELTKLVGHEHHCYICGDEGNLYWVTTKDKSQAILCEDCIKIQKSMGNIFISKKPYRRSNKKST